jgi:hypothetical protein|nr:MAG TPA: Protein of unknown function (DUF2612) [Caudoviricetes sp.]
MRIADYVEALPDSYKKTAASNNYKLLYLEWLLMSGFWADIQAIQDTADIAKATGKTLDLYGSIYNQARGGMTDEQYRVIIMQKVARYWAGGDYNSTVKALAGALGVSPSEFVLTEKDNPRQIEVSRLPFSILNEIGITSKQIFQIIEAMLPVGIPLAPLTLDGTFEFSASADEQSDTAGFGDIEQTVGGYFGALETGNIDIPT